MLRAGRFKHRLLDDTFLKSRSATAHKLLLPLLIRWQKKELSNFDMVTCYLLILLALRRPNDFMSGKSPLHTNFETSENLKTGTWFFEEEPEIFLSDELASLKNFNQPVPLSELFVRHNFRSIPLSVNRTMANWISGNYPLILTTKIPSAIEVLAMQARGQRCISMLMEPEQFADLIEEGRDVLGFIVHDLIHADHFFFDREKATGQILFSQKLMVLHGDPRLQEWIQRDPHFAKEFTYLMSDMNSVPLHLIKTLKAIGLGYYKRQNGIELSKALTLAQENDFKQVFRWLIHPWGLNEDELQLFDKINTFAFCWNSDAYQVQGLLMQQKEYHTRSDI